MAIPNKKADSESPQANCIAAIDFGTSSVSLAYTTSLNKGDVHLLKLNKIYERVPNAILLHKTEGTDQCIVEEFGYTAQSNYSALKKNELDEYIYFQEIKTAIQTKKYVDKPVTVTSLNGETYYLIEVIAFIFKHIKNVMLHQLNDPNLKASNFDWVITVPAIWKARARRMMREAAYLAGLTCDDGGITKFTDTSRGTLPRPLEVNPHKLTLALEPEAAAIYAHKYSNTSSHHSLEQEASPSTTSPPSFPNRYTVVDIGGGTIDITVHDRSESKIDVKLQPNENARGGAYVNQAFQNMIEDLVQDKGHQRFLEKPIAKPALNKLYYEIFEKQKKTFGDQPQTDETEKPKNTTADQPITDASEEIKITFPPTFVEFYKKDYIERRAREKGMTLEDNELYIQYDILEKTIFLQPIDNIISCVKSALDQVKNKVDTIYLVGGFGGSSYVKHSLQKALASEHGIKYDHIICPQRADFAVTIGAVLWRQDPDIIQSRIADATYGIGVAPIFKPSIHDEHYKCTDENGKECCNSLLQPFKEKGKTIQQGLCYEVLLKFPTIKLYATTKDNVQYTVDKEGKPTVTKIGELTINKEDHVVQGMEYVHISIEFIHNEILVTGTLNSTGEVVKTVCDTLSYHEDMDIIPSSSNSEKYDIIDNKSEEIETKF